MNTIGVRELQRNAGRVLERVRKSRRPELITHRGHPTAAIVPLDQDALEDWVLVNSRDIVASLADADANLKAARTLSAAEMRSKLGLGAKSKGGKRRSK